MWHNLGKVNVTKGSDVVTGVGTKWVENVRVGDAFQGPDGKLYQVINVASDEALAISPAYEGDTATSLNYWIVPIPGYSKIQADRLSLIISKLDGDILSATEAADRAQTAMQQIQQWHSEVAVHAADAMQAADIAQQAADDAVAVVTGGTASIEPEAGKIPIAGADATIKQAWIKDLEFELDRLRVATNKTLYGDGPYPSLDLQFQGAKILDPRVTFVRSTPKWDYYGKQYGVNEPVFTDKGLLLEPQRTNLVEYSSDLTKWRKVDNITVETTESVLGFPHGTFIQGTNNSSYVYSSPISFEAGEIYMLSCVFELLPGSTHFGFYLSGGGVSVTRIVFKKQGSEYVLEQNEFSSDPIATPLGNNCVRVSVWYSPSEAIERNLAIHGITILQYNPVVVSHAQVEQIRTDATKIPSSPIITNGTQVTRAEDQFVVIFGDWYSPSEGALVLRIGDGSALNRVSNDLIPYPLGLVSNNPVVHDPDFKGVYFGSDSGVIRNVWVGIGGENRDAVVTHDIYPNDTLCLAWNHDTLTLAVNGEIVGTATDERVPMALQGALGFLINPNLGMQLPYLSFYNRALSDSEMIAITS